MKTALEILKKNMKECDTTFADKNGDGYVDASLHSVIQSMRKYASQYIDLASEKASVGFITDELGTVMGVKKESILKIKDQLK